MGYDRRAGLIYLAVVVRDKDNVVHPASHKGPDSNILKTDAVEVYVDGTFSKRNGEEDGPLMRRQCPCSSTWEYRATCQPMETNGALTLRCSIAREPGNGARR